MAPHRHLSRVAAIAVVGALAIVGPLGALAAAGTGADAAEATATLQVEKDQVEVRKAGKQAFKPAKDEQKLQEGDTVRTDATGRAEIQYDDESYTRLDVDTTFTVVSLSDDQGNRKVEGSLDSGRTWNRAEGLTESESFAQSGAGATAAVQGTAFAVECHTVDDCDYVGVVDDTELTGTDGQKQLLTLDLCKSLSGILCAELTKLGPGALFDWIQENLLRDLLERGYGPGPFPGFTGTISVSNGILTVTETPTTPTTTDVLAGDPIGCDVNCDQVVPFAFELPEGFVAGNAIALVDSFELEFVANLTVSPAGLFVVFTQLPAEDGPVHPIFYDDGEGHSHVELGVPYPAATVFGTYGEYEGSDSFTFHIEDASGNQVSRDATVPINVTSSTCTTCFASVPQSPPTPGAGGGGDGRNGGPESGEPETTPTG